MNRIGMVTGLSFLALLACSDVNAKIWTQSMNYESPAAPGLSTVAEIMATPETPQIIGGEEVVFAEVRFFDDLESGTEVELWAAESDSASVDSTLGRSVWITDQRTGSLVRFDVTMIVRAWEAEELPNHGFIIRVVGPASGESSSPATFSTPSNLVLRYHTGPRSSGSDEPRSRRQGRDKHQTEGEN